MANMLDYVLWRGDVPFFVSPFNEVDNLLFATIAYVDMSDIFDNDTQSITMQEAVAVYRQKNENIVIDMGLLLNDKIPELFCLAGTSERYKNVRMFAYKNHMDTKAMVQFCAVCFALPDGTTYVAYRGTDDTLVGWQEDFNMSFSSEVPAQKYADEYLRMVANSSTNMLRVGGHSKGGNLAVYASVKAGQEIQRRILQIYNNDGPGFGSNVLQSAEYLAVREKVHTYLPQESYVGMLLEHEQEYEVVKSAQTGPFQHDSVSWQVFATKLERAEDVDQRSHNFDIAVKEWLSALDDSQRATFVDTVFQVLTSGGAQTLSDLSKNILKTLEAATKTLKNMPKKERDFMLKGIELFLRAHIKASLPFTMRSEEV